MKVAQFFFLSMWRWVMAPVIGAISVFILLPLVWIEFVLLEAMIAYVIGLFNFVWSQLLYQSIYLKPFEQFLQSFFCWNSLKALIIFAKACFVMFFTQLQSDLFVMALFVSYFIFLFYEMASVYMRSVYTKK